MTKVSIVMSNDYPDSAFTNEVVAEAYAERRMQEQRAEIAKKHPGSYQPSPRVYYRVYSMDLDYESAPMDWKQMYGTYGL